MSLFGPPDTTKLKDRGKVKSLVKALYYKEDATIRQSAASALDALDWKPTNDEDGARYWIEKREWDKCVGIGSAAVKPLTEKLIDEKTGELKYHDDRCGIIAALGKINAPGVVDVIIATFAFKSRSVHIEAVKALGHIGDDRAVMHLISLLEDGYSSEVPEAAMDTLIEIGTPAVEHLILALNDLSKFTRNRAAKVLDSIGDSRAVEPLVFLLSDKEWWVREAAEEALVKFGKLSVEPLCGLLQEKDDSLRERAVWLLGRIGDTQAVEPLIEVLEKDKDNEKYIVRRSSAAEALIEISDDRAARPISTWLISGSSKYRTNKVEWIPELLATMPDRLGRELDMAIVAGAYWISVNKWEACVDLGSGLLPLFNAIVLNTAVHPNDKQRAARLMVQVDETRSVDILVDFLGHQESDVREAAVCGLYKFGWERCSDRCSNMLPLLEAIVLTGEEINGGYVGKVSDRYIKDYIKTAADALSQVGKTEGIKHLLLLLRDKNWRVRGAALHGLKTAGWEPENDVERAALWVNSGEEHRLSELDIDAIQSLLIEILEWQTPDDRWPVKGKAAILLKRPGIIVSENILAQADEALEAYARMYADFLDDMVNHPWLKSKKDDEAFNENIFEDYTDLIYAAISVHQWHHGDGSGGRWYFYDTEPSHSAVKDLCKIKTPVSANLLHHLSRLEDPTVISRHAEVEYSSEHPSGMATVNEIISLKKQRNLATRELARRGNPEYDTNAYKVEGCWRLPVK